ncbi:MAG TPA: CHRD domain-containing protein [Methylocystis sp.]|nr:CHRD domain-containing protein [Methylocystis sp.]
MRYKIAAMALVASLSLAPTLAKAADFTAQLSGFEEVGELNNESGAIMTAGEATLLLTIDQKSQRIQYQLVFGNTSSAVTQAHIHFGRERQPGGPIAFLCSSLGNGPAGTPRCPATGGTVAGTISIAQLLGIPGQNVPPNSFDALAAMLLSHSAYVNIHTMRFPSGELRGQIVPAS